MWSLLLAVALGSTLADDDLPEKEDVFEAPTGVGVGVVTVVTPRAFEVRFDGDRSLAFLRGRPLRLALAGAGISASGIERGQQVMVAWERDDGPPTAVRVDVLAPSPLAP